MRKYFMVLIAAGTLALSVQGASAEWIKLGKRSTAEVGRACNQAGVNLKLYEGGGYGCVKENCDGKGGDCEVLCTKDGECDGWTPGRATPPPGKYDLVKILKFSPRVPPGHGLLEPSPDASPHGPSGPGTPKPTAPPPRRLY